MKLMLTRANLLLLDEPTNHLDIASREALENALDEYNGTVIIVTHDRYLVNRLADRILHMTHSGLTEYIGGYDDYIEALKNDTAGFGAAEKPVSANAREYKETKQLRSDITKAKTAVSRAEKSIAETEAALDEMNVELAKPHIASDYKKAGELSAKAEALRAKLDLLYEEWEAADARLKELSERGQQ